MNTIVLEKPGLLKNTQKDSPVEVPEGFALVRVRRIGVCGTDWHAFRGKQPFFVYPRILGHELGVVVEKVNDSKSPLMAGDQCAVEPYLDCGQCIACRNGKTNCCANLKVIGVHIDGGMCEQMLVPAGKLHKSEKLSLDELALVEPLGIGCHAVQRAGIAAGEWVLVIGAGPIGLSVVPFVRAAGGNVIVMDISMRRLEFCRSSMNVSHTIDGNGGDLVADLKKLTSGDLPTCVIDATGSPQSMARCFDYPAPGGRIVFVGIFQGDLTFNDPNFHRREMTILASRNARPDDFGRIIRMLESGQISTTPWITHRARFDDAAAEFSRWLQPDSGVLKAMIEV